MFSTGSHGGDSIPDLEIPRFIKLINSGKMQLECSHKNGYKWWGRTSSREYE